MTVNLFVNFAKRLGSLTEQAPLRGPILHHSTRGFVALHYVILKFLRVNLAISVRGGMNMLIRFFCLEYIFSELVRIMAIRNRAVAIKRCITSEAWNYNLPIALLLLKS